MSKTTTVGLARKVVDGAPEDWQGRVDLSDEDAALLFNDGPDLPRIVGLVWDEGGKSQIVRYERV